MGLHCAPPALLADDVRTGRLVLLSDVPVQTTFDYYVLEPHEFPGGKLDARETFKSWLLRQAAGG